MLSKWGCSSHGRALALHARGSGIDARRLQVLSKCALKIWFFSKIPLTLYPRPFVETFGQILQKVDWFPFVWNTNPVSCNLLFRTGIGLFFFFSLGGLLLGVPFHRVWPNSRSKQTNKWMSSNVWKSSLYWMAFMNFKVYIIHNFYHNIYILYKQIQFKNGWMNEWMTSIHLDVIQMFIVYLAFMDEFIYLSWMKYVQPNEFLKSDYINMQYTWKITQKNSRSK